MNSKNKVIPGNAPRKTENESPGKRSVAPRKRKMRRPTHLRLPFHLMQWTPSLTDRHRKRLEIIRKTSSFSSDEQISDLRETNFNQRVKKMRSSASSLLHKLELWRSSLKVIEGHHGSGVTSYFVFLRWCLLLNVCIFLLMFSFIVIPQIIYDNRNQVSTKINSTDNFSEIYIEYNEETLAEKCKNSYEVIVSESFNVIDLLHGTDWMERTVLFYGFYTGSKLIGGVFTYDMALAYLLVPVTCLLLSIILMARASVKRFSENFQKDKVKTPFFDLIFCSWDYNIMKKEAVLSKKHTIQHGINSDLAEKAYVVRHRRMLPKDRLYLLSTRVFVNLFVIICLVAAGLAIFYVTKYSTQFSKSPTNRNIHKFIKLLVGYSPSVTIAVLNTVLPLIFAQVIVFEDYFPGHDVIVTLARSILLRLSSLALLIASVYRDITCQPKDECGVGVAACAQLHCWETNYGQHFYRLAILDFFLAFVAMLIAALQKLMVTTHPYRLCKWIGLPEFNVPKSVLDLVYCQSLCWLGLFFSPLLPSITVISIFLNFYLKRTTAVYLCIASERPYNASKSGSLFATVMVITFFLCCLPIGYTIKFISPSKSCGPFSLFYKMYSVIENTVAGWPSVANFYWFLFTSAPFILILIIFLLWPGILPSFLYSKTDAFIPMVKLATASYTPICYCLKPVSFVRARYHTVFIIYWIRSKSAVRNDQIQHLRNQVARERREKQYFMFEHYKNTDKNRLVEFKQPVNNSKDVSVLPKSSIVGMNSSKTHSAELENSSQDRLKPVKINPRSPHSTARFTKRK